MSKSNFTRRDLLKSGGLFLFVAMVFGRLFKPASVAHAQGKAAAPAAKDAPAKGKGADTAADMVKESDPTAQALGYHVDAKKVDTKKWPKRAGAEGSKQFCYNCQFYQVKGDAKASKSAPCTIFANKPVAGQGWCNSWVQNPNVKG